jgi:putative protein-disulfide isomerase
MKTETEFIYVYDALCGWCYGFAPVVQRLHEKYRHDVPFTVVSGGLALGDRVQPVSSMAAYILDAIPLVERTTGVQFGEPYKQLLRAGTTISNSEPPAVALGIVKDKLPERAVEFAHALQQAHFVHGKSLSADATYEELAYHFDLQPAQFVDHMKGLTYTQKAHDDFTYAHRLGINGFPATLFRIGEKYWLLSRGYQEYDYLDRALTELITTPVR